MTVIGAINGLICLSKPSYSDMSTIPPPHSMLPRLHYETSIRFGFDPKTDDYKLVKLTGLRDTANCFGSVKEWVQVEVYSMRKKSWEFITQPFPSYITRIKNNDYLCVDGHDGHLHWENKIEETIVAFDLGSETFREILLPDSILDSNHRFHRLVVLDGKLCEISCRYDGAWEVWVMEEYGVPQSWVKRHVFPKFTFASWRLPFGFTSHNELLHVDEHAQLVLYDLVANKTKLTPKKQIANKIVEYVDSLVWV
ncbi:F-box/kelch-repeat protein At3g06240 [Lactuca sativa]|uniref:F-box associated beta-propeller type 3 domain-containing protein n=1 Tax=Lactuca sativa TaxID=4236 RepID=A0A9R1V051_LACSA|nr:F-box/kelch-repeat protein At3g06240 [Lactuca sativa]KAJ0195963.1 hypothetical protein LSAT_V11C700345110 [Lactuca sativa]